MRNGDKKTLVPTESEIDAALVALGLVEEAEGGYRAAVRLVYDET